MIDSRTFTIFSCPYVRSTKPHFDSEEEIAEYDWLLSFLITISTESRIKKETNIGDKWCNRINAFCSVMQ